MSDQTPEERRAFREKIETIGIAGKAAGTSRTTPVPRDDRPGVAGTVTEHWDGRQDATIFADPATQALRVREPNQ